MKRREFIKSIGITSLGLPLTINKVNYSTIFKPLFSIDEAAKDRVLIIIRMNGGNDGLNTVIPLDSYDKLVVHRSNIMLPKNEILDLKTNNLGLHSSMSGMQNLFKEGKLSIIQNVGYENQNRSHFKSTDIWSRGLIGNNGTAGWLGRYLDEEFANFPEDYPSDEYPDPFAVSVGNNVSSTCQGLDSNFSMAVPNPENVRQLSTSINHFEDTNYGHKLKFINEIVDQSNSYSLRIEEAISKGNSLSTMYDDKNSLAKKLRGVAKLISGGLETKVYILNVNGFDTHSGQVVAGNPNIGKHERLLKKIADAVASFQDDLNLLGIEERVLGMTFSEFGRQIASNASYGTDHGEAAPMFLFGTCVQNPVLGNNPTITDEIIPQKAVDYEYDFRDVYASVLKDWFYTPKPQIQSMFEHEINYLPIISCGNNLNNELDDEVIIYPNPTINTATVSFSSENERVSLAIFDRNGRLIKYLFDKDLPKEKHQLPIDVSFLSEGLYIFNIVKNSGDLSVRLMKISAKGG